MGLTENKENNEEIAKTKVNEENKLLEKQLEDKKEQYNSKNSSSLASNYNTNNKIKRTLQ